jgi:hypothetical protein
MGCNTKLQNFFLPLPLLLFSWLGTMSVNTLGPAALAAALRQIVNAPGFAAANPHLSAATAAAITLGQWPNTPVFTPYAITHHGYSQSKYPLTGVTLVVDF